MSQPARPLPQPAPDTAGVLVLTGRPLRAGIDLQDTARFSDDIWSLTPAIHQLHTRALSLNFTTIPAAFRLVCKELFLAILTGDQPAGTEPCQITTIRSQFSHVKEFLTWADAHGATTLASLGETDVAAFGRHVDAQRRSVVTRESKQRAVRLFWLFRSRLAADALTADPALVLGMPYTRPTRRPVGENTTDRIPEQVLAPLLVWALRFVDDFADDILAADTERTRLYATGRPGPHGHRGARPRLATLLDDYRRQRKPLPGRGIWSETAHQQAPAEPATRPAHRPVPRST